jgi:hypothetical protein
LWGVKLSYNTNPQIGIISTDANGNSSECVYSNMTMTEVFSLEFEDIILTKTQAGFPANFIPEILNLSIPVESGCVAIIGGVYETDLTDNLLRIFPNPSSGNFSVAFQETRDFSFDELTILNANGKTVYRTIDRSCLLNGINPGYLPDGLYLVRLISGNSAFTGKLLIKH